MQTLTFDVHGMTCGGCTGSVQRALGKIAGVSHAAVSVRPGTATVEVDATRVTHNEIEAVISSLGYQAKLLPTKSRATS